MSIVLTPKKYLLFFRYLTKNPHVSGNVHNNHLADFIAKKWEKYGFDSVEKVVYNVLLSFPDKDNPNKVILKTNNLKLKLIIFLNRYTY